MLVPFNQGRTFRPNSEWYPIENAPLLTLDRQSLKKTQKAGCYQSKRSVVLVLQSVYFSYPPEIKEAGRTPIFRNYSCQVFLNRLRLRVDSYLSSISGGASKLPDLRQNSWGMDSMYDTFEYSSSAFSENPIIAPPISSATLDNAANAAHIDQANAADIESNEDFDQAQGNELRPEPFEKAFMNLFLEKFGNMHAQLVSNYKY
jgi:hypothetical protein